MCAIFASFCEAFGTFIIADDKADPLKQAIAKIFYFGLVNSVFSPIMAKVYLKKDGAHFWRSTFLLVKPYKQIFPFVAIVASVVCNGLFIHTIQLVYEDKSCNISASVPAAAVSFCVAICTLFLTLAVYREVPTVIQSVGMALVLASIICYIEAK